MIQQQKLSFQSMSLQYDFFLRYHQSKDLTLSAQLHQNAILGVLRWLNRYQNIKELSHLGKNPLLRYNPISDEYNCIASSKTVRLDCEGKNPFVRFYLQQDQVKGKTNLAEIYIHAELDKLMQLNQTQQHKKLSQKWRGRVQNVLLQWRQFVQSKIKNQGEVSVAVRIQLAQ